MDIYLDDIRKAPEGWVQARWPEDVIKLLKTGEVRMISLDHDLGEDQIMYTQPRTGYDVLLWIEEQVAKHNFKPPTIIIHSQNVPAKQKMKAAARKIRDLHRKNKNIENPQ